MSPCAPRASLRSWFRDGHASGSDVRCIGSGGDERWVGEVFQGERLEHAGTALHPAASSMLRALPGEQRRYPRSCAAWRSMSSSRSRFSCTKSCGVGGGECFLWWWASCLLEELPSADAALSWASWASPRDSGDTGDVWLPFWTIWLAKLPPSSAGLDPGGVGAPLNSPAFGWSGWGPGDLCARRLLRSSRPWPLGRTPDRPKAGLRGPALMVSAGGGEGVASGDEV